MAAALLAAAGPPRQVIADRAYDAGALRRLLAEQATETVIPSTRSRKTPIPHDRQALSTQPHRAHVLSPEGFPTRATRYDKLARNYSAAVHLAAIAAFWLNRARP
jgi:transposase